MGRASRCFRGLLLVACVAIGLMSPAAPTAVAGSSADLTPIVAELSKDSFAATNRAVGALGTSADPRAAAILGALQGGRLFFVAGGARLVVKDVAGRTTDAVTGASVELSGQTLAQVRLNNRVRGTLDAALGTLRLAAPNPEDRKAAALTVLSRRDLGALPAVIAAAARETNPAVADALAMARAGLTALKTDAPEADRVKAVRRISELGGYEALGIIDQVLATSTGGLHDVALSAKSKVQLGLTLWGYARNALYGLSLGSVLLLAAIGLAITFGVMGVINMAHGEMVMIGAYTTYVVQQLIQSYAPGLFQASLFIALPVAFVVSGLVGILIERTVIRLLYGRPLETLLATYGVSLILQQAVRSIFGANNKDVGTPDFMAGALRLGGMSITQGRMWIIVFSIIVFLALLAVLRLTPFGLKIRAVTQNRRMAAAMGIDTNRMDALAFGLGSAVAGVAGVALSQIDNVSPNLGQSYIIDAFMVVVFGGVGNLWGTLVAALTLGLCNKLIEPVAGAVLAKIAVLIFIVLFIQRRPSGLFALKGRAVEA